MSKVHFLNVTIDNLTEGEAVSLIDKMIQQRNNSFVVTPNVDHLVLLDSNDELRKAYGLADLVLADGMPLVWFSQFYGEKIKEKISGSDLLPKLCELSAQKGYKLFFLGAVEGVAKRAASNMERQYAGLQKISYFSPPLGFENDPKQMENIDKRIKEAQPDILAVALGCPKQEILIAKNKDRWNVPVSLGVGAALDFLAGEKKRAPKWMSRCGLEWFFRMSQEPRRMFKRYVLRDVFFLKLLWKYRKHNKISAE